ncbi:MAG: flagellar export protein FliJ [Nitrospiria bacterium]
MLRQQTSLDTVLRYRSHLVEAVQRELAELKHRLSIEEDRLHRMDQRRREVINDMAERQNNGIKPEEISLSYQFIKRQGERIEDQQKIVKALTEQCEAQRVRLERLLREKKIVEKVQEKRQAIQADLLKKNENAILDEVSGRRERRVP